MLNVYVCETFLVLLSLQLTMNVFYNAYTYGMSGNLLLHNSKHKLIVRALLQSLSTLKGYIAIATLVQLGSFNLGF